MTLSFVASVNALDVEDVRRYVRLGRKRVRVGWRRMALSVARSPRSLDAESALDSLSESPHVLFLCLGNICRSPMAERYLRQRLRDSEGPDVTVESAGFIEEENRQSPDHAVTAAAEYGVDLTEHRSSVVTEAMLLRSDLVFLMDAYNYTRLDRQYGEFLERAYFLKSFGEFEGFEVYDPFRAEAEEYRRVYGEVADALDAFADRLEEWGR